MRHALLALAVLPPLVFALAGCVSPPSRIVRDAFAASYACPVTRIDVRPEPGSDRFYRAEGCGMSVTYNCGGAGATECRARERVEYEATDDTSHGAWLDEDANARSTMAREAAMASAAHDVPCDRASLRVAGSDASGQANVIEGCGQRVTYRIEDVAAEQPAASPSQRVEKHKYVVVSRSPLAAQPAPPASATPTPTPSASEAPAPAPAAPPPATPAAPAPASVPSGLPTTPR